MNDQSMASIQSDAMSILSDAVAVTVTGGIQIAKIIFCLAVCVNVIFLYLLLKKVYEHQPAPGRMTLA